MTNRKPEGERRRRGKAKSSTDKTPSNDATAPRAPAKIASLLLAGDAENVFEPADIELTEEVAASIDSPDPSSVPLGRTLTVGCGAEHSTLREALEQAADGARIVVRPGRYAENIVIDRQVTLVGDGPREAIVIGPSTGCPVWISASGAQVRGVTIVGASDADEEWPSTSAVVCTASDVMLIDCEIRDARLSGVLVHGAGAGLVLEASQIRHCGEAGVFAAEGAGASLQRCRLVGHGGPAVVVGVRGRVALVDCQLRRGSSHGVTVGAAGHLQMTGCDVSAHAGNGVVVEAGGTLAANGCSFRRNGENGVCVEVGSMAADVMDCTYSDNAMESWSAPESLRQGFGGIDWRPSASAPANA